MADPVEELVRADFADLIERIESAAALIQPLGRQGEDYIWRPVDKALVHLQNVRDTLSRFNAERGKERHAIKVANAAYRTGVEGMRAELQTLRALRLMAKTAFQHIEALPREPRDERLSTAQTEANCALANMIPYELEHADEH